MPHQQPQQSSGYALPAIGSVQHQQGPAEADRDRMMRQREMDERLSVQRDAAEREREREREQHRNREAHRAAEVRDYELNERQRRIESRNQPHQNHAGSIPIHQPVASKVPSTIHGPGGLLSGMGGGAGPVPSTAPMTGSNGPGGGFGPPTTNNGNPRPMQHHPPPTQHTHYRPMPAPGAMTGLTQGQQPILNVSKLDGKTGPG
jgi:paired amphipathic helix protein Sin3a